MKELGAFQAAAPTMNITLAESAEGERDRIAGQPSSALIALRNGDFEEGSGAAPSGWDIHFWPRQQPSRLTSVLARISRPPAPQRRKKTHFVKIPIRECIYRSREQAHSGAWSLKVDTRPVLGQDVYLAFVGDVAANMERLAGKTVVLSGWVYVQPGTAERPMMLRLRTFSESSGKEIEVWVNDPLMLMVVGEPGKWMPFRGTGTIPKTGITRVDVHTSIVPDEAPVIQFFDQLRVEALAPGPFEIRTLQSSFWRDAPELAVEVILQSDRSTAEESPLPAVQGEMTLELELISEDRRVTAL